MFRMPAEWDLHEGTWLAWPHNEDHWPGNFSPIPHVYSQVIHALARSEKVFICVNDAGMEEAARKVLQETRDNIHENVVFVHIRTDTSWSRDHGPIFVEIRKADS